MEPFYNVAEILFGRKRGPFRSPKVIVTTVANALQVGAWLVEQSKSGRTSL